MSDDSLNPLGSRHYMLLMLEQLVLDDAGDVVAEVEKHLWVRKKRPSNSSDRE